MNIGVLLNMNKYNYSFIIPHKNNPDLLQRCVKSIPLRDDIQIIVVDDNSDEGKKPSLPERSGVEIVLLDASRSKGAGRARNVGLANAEGKWLLFPDSDDFYNPDFLLILDNYMKSDNDVIYFSFDFRDGKTGKDLPSLSFKKQFDNFDGSREAREEIKFNHNVAWTKMVRRDYIEQNNILFEETLNGNDILFSLKVGYYTEKMEVIKKPLYVYLRNENSLVTQKATIASAMCQLTHKVKHNYFVSYINHPEWKSSILKSVVIYTMNLGIPYVVSVLVNINRLFLERKEWVEVFYKE